MQVVFMTGHMSHLIEADQIPESNGDDGYFYRSPLQAIVSERRAIKFFCKQHKVEQKLVDALILNASLAPSAFNLQHWKILQIKEKLLRNKIAECSWHQPQICDASVLLVVLLDKLAWKRTDRLVSNIACEETRKKHASTLASLYEKNEELARDEAMRSCSMFSMLLMLSAQEQGLVSCPMTGCDFEKLHQLLALPDEHEVCMLIAVGKAAQENRIRERKRLHLSSILQVV
jgi:nitroreductase